MPNPSPSAKDSDRSFRLGSPLAGFLSYLVPGLGQMYQGRIGKGLLFFVCLYGLFFYGMLLGKGEARAGDVTYTVSSNVYLPDTADKNNAWGMPRLLANLYNRPQYAGQFWIGIAAWPAVWQYNTHGDVTDDDLRNDEARGDAVFGNFERTPPDVVINELQRKGDKTWDLAWVYTVVAGVLNVLVIYDAFSGPLFIVGGENAGPAKGSVPS